MATKIRQPEIPAGLEEVASENVPLLFYDAREEETDLEGIIFREVILTEAELCGMSFRGVIFENCRFMHCKLRKTSFIDVIFRSCDFSGSNFTEGYFSRCQFQSCKCMGTVFYGSGFSQVAILDGNFQYVDLDHSSLLGVSIKESNFRSSNLADCKLKQFTLFAVEFCEASFFRTSLKGIDLTECQIDGIALSDGQSELRGAVVNVFQAVELAKRLGVVVK